VSASELALVSHYSRLSLTRYDVSPTSAVGRCESLLTSYLVSHYSRVTLGPVPYWSRHSGINSVPLTVVAIFYSPAGTNPRPSAFLSSLHAILSILSALLSSFYLAIPTSLLYSRGYQPTSVCFPEQRTCYTEQYLTQPGHLLC